MAELTEALRKALEGWRVAEQARIDAIATYNDKLAADRERGEFPPRVAPEYAAMECARRVSGDALRDLWCAINTESGRSALKDHPNG